MTNLKFLEFNTKTCFTHQLQSTLIKTSKHNFLNINIGKTTEWDLISHHVFHRFTIRFYTRLLFFLIYINDISKNTNLELILLVIIQLQLSNKTELKIYQL